LAQAILIIFPLFLSVILFGIDAFSTIESTNIELNDGLGFNPVLQSNYNLFHPPLLFIGFSFLFIPYLIALILLIFSVSK
jgi:cytochrome c biogenesis factor